MISARRASLLIMLLVLTACAMPSIASAPMVTSTPRALPQTAAAGPAQRVELAAGHYQLLMLYSPL